MNKHLELLQWCMDNWSEDFKVSYEFSLGLSWIHALNGDLTFHCVENDAVDNVITELNKAKEKNTPDVIREKRKQELLKELAELEGK